MSVLNPACGRSYVERSAPRLQSRTDPRWKGQTKPEDGPTKREHRDYEDSIDSGFQIATFQGPLCAEPVMGMAYFLDEVKQNPEVGKLRIAYKVHTCIDFALSFDVCS